MSVFVLCTYFCKLKHCYFDIIAGILKVTTFTYLIKIKYVE